MCVLCVLYAEVCNCEGYSTSICSTSAGPSTPPPLAQAGPPSSQHIDYIQSETAWKGTSPPEDHRLSRDVPFSLSLCVVLVVGLAVIGTLYVLLQYLL